MAEIKQETAISREVLDKLIKDINSFFENDNIEKAARETRFVQRESKLTGHLFLIVFVFAMSVFETPTLEQLIGLLDLVEPELEITREGFHQRINDCAVKFFEFLLAQAININIKNVELDLLKQFNRVILLDSTAFQLPEELADVFAGCGGDASDAGIKIQFGYDLKSSHFFYLIHEGKLSDNSYSNSFVDEIELGDLIIKDLGYFSITVSGDTDKKGAYYLSRFKSNVNVYQMDENGDLVAVDLVNLIGKMTEDIIELEVYLKNTETIIKTRLVIEKVPDIVREKRIRKLNQGDKKRGRTTSDKTKALQAVNIYISNAPSEFLVKENFRKLYAIRWQVELVFKNWKSNFGLSKVTGHREARVKCMIYAKLLFIFVTTKMTCCIKHIVWATKHREISEFRAAKHIKVKASEWLRILILEPETAVKFLSKILDFVSTHCIKRAQKGRTYPFEILEQLSLT
jgi:hypothetical protein